MFVIPEDLPARLYPLAWLVGSWQGEGIFAQGENKHKQFIITTDFIASSNDVKYQAEIIYNEKVWLSESGTLKIGDVRNCDKSIFENKTSSKNKIDSKNRIIPLNKEVSKTPLTHSLTFSLKNSREFSTEYSGWVSNGRIEFNSSKIRNLLSREKEISKQPILSKRMYGYVKGDLYYAWDLAENLSNDKSAKLDSYISAILKRRD
ncbi:MAG: FABP family protein [Bifidobacteriaceae bacterium]|jgi:hypothetical protein|nr:FABP family protein [Bifidobacteriaceae bacterium]